jgi:CHAT domain-containing protein
MKYILAGLFYLIIILSTNAQSSPAQYYLDSWESLQYYYTYQVLLFGKSSDEESDLEVISRYKEAIQVISPPTIDDPKYLDVIDLVRAAYIKQDKESEAKETLGQAIGQVEKILGPFSNQNLTPSENQNFEVFQERLLTWYELNENMGKVDSLKSHMEVIPNETQNQSNGTKNNNIETKEKIPVEELITKFSLLFAQGKHEELTQQFEQNIHKIKPSDSYVLWNIVSVAYHEIEKDFRAENLGFMLGVLALQEQAKDDPYIKSTLSQVTNIFERVGNELSEWKKDSLMKSALNEPQFKALQKRIGSESPTHYDEYNYNAGNENTVAMMEVLINPDQLLPILDKLENQESKQEVPDEEQGMLTYFIANHIDGGFGFTNYNPKQKRFQAWRLEGVYRSIEWLLPYKNILEQMTNNGVNPWSEKEAAETFRSYLESEQPMLDKDQSDRLEKKFHESTIMFTDHILGYMLIDSKRELLDPKYGEDDVRENWGLIDAILIGLEIVPFLPMFDLIQEEYGKVDDLVDFRQIGNISYAPGILEEINKHRNLDLNIFRRLNEIDGYDVFKTADNSTYFKDFVINYNSVLATKGVEHRLHRFLKEGASYSDVCQIKYDSMLSLQKNLSEVLLLTEEQKIKRGWTDESIAEEHAKIQDTQKSLFEEISNTTNFTLFARDWVVTLVDIQRSLKSDEAYVDLYRVHDLEETINYTQHPIDTTTYYSYLFVIVFPDKPPLIHRIDSREIDLEREFVRYRNLINSKMLQKNGFDLFWKPIQDYLEEYNRIYFSPDGIYHAIALEGLQMEDGRFLIDEIEVIRVSDVSKLKKDLSKQEFNNIHLFGAPDYNLDEPDSLGNSQYRSAVYGGKWRRNPLSPLPGSKVEVDQIKVIAEESNIPHIYTYTEEQASEANLIRAKIPNVLHLATHGKYFGKIAKDNDQVFHEDSRRRFEKNPLLKSHLYLSGANKTLLGKYSGPNDGVISAEEISYMDFSSTQLVVLSACESGLGELYAGEGVFGLIRAFSISGADYVLSTLWEVDDRATQQFMVLFYRGLIKDKLGIYESFYQAKYELRKRFPNPIFWAPFVLVH